VSPVADITGVILAGGASSRFGENKALTNFLGVPIIKRIANVMNVVFNDVLLVTNSPEAYAHLGLRMAQDDIPGQGPMGGIVAAFDNTLNDRIFVVACDMPILQPITIETVIAQAGFTDAAVATHDGIKEYLLALYSRNLLHRLRCCLEEGQGSLKDFLTHIPNVTWVPVEGDAWFNVNTKKDLEFLEKHHAG